MPGPSSEQKPLTRGERWTYVLILLAVFGLFGLDIAVEPHAAVHVGLDAVVELVQPRLIGQPAQVWQQVRPPDVDRLEDRVGEAEGAARSDLGPQPEMGGAETDGSAVRVARPVPGAVHGPLGGGRVVVATLEEPALPAPAVTAPVRR